MVPPCFNQRLAIIQLVITTQPALILIPGVNGPTVKIATLVKYALAWLLFRLAGDLPRTCILSWLAANGLLSLLMECAYSSRSPSCFIVSCRCL